MMITDYRKFIYNQKWEFPHSLLQANTLALQEIAFGNVVYAGNVI